MRGLAISKLVHVDIPFSQDFESRGRILLPTSVPNVAGFTVKEAVVLGAVADNF